MVLGESFQEQFDKVLSEEEASDELSKPLWNLQSVQAYKAREEFKVNGEGVTVAVIDSGIDNKHPELEGKVIDAFNIEKNGNVDLEDRLGHGTAVAGIIAGNRTGVAPGVKLISVKTRLDIENHLLHLLYALDFCAVKKPDTDIINICSGRPIYSDILKETCDKVVGKGMIVVASAGNNYIGTHFPASYNSVISVAAFQQLDTVHSMFSNIWPTVDISAPGDKVLTTSPLDKSGALKYIGFRGTSAAAPHISGILALGISLLKKKQKERYIPNPELLETTLKETAIDVSKEKPYREEALKLLKLYRSYYDQGGVFLKDTPEVIKAIYGSGLVRTYEFLKRLDEKS